MATMQQKRSRPYPIERRPPQLLRDLLRQDSCCNNSSCSSSGFKSLPRFPSSESNLRLQPHTLTTHTKKPPPQEQQPTPSFKRSRSRSRAAAEATVSLLHKLLNAVMKPPSRISRKSSEKNTDGVVVNRVRVKDILRWKSFRDLIDGQDERPSKQLEPCTLDTDTESVSGNSIIVSSSRLAAEQVEVKDDEEELTRLVVGEYCGSSSSGNLAAGTEEDELLLDGVKMGPPQHIPKSRLLGPIINSEEDDHGTPVSVLDSPFNYRDEDNESYYDEESSLTSLDQTLTNIERTKQRLLENLKWFESLAAAGGVDQQQTDEQDEEITEELESSSSIIDDEGEKADQVVMELQSDDALLLYNINDQDSRIFFEPDGYHNNTCDSNRLIIHGGMKNIKAKIDRNCDTGAAQCGMLKGSYKYNQLSKECMEIKELGEHWNKGIIDEERDQLTVDIEIVLLNELLDEFLFQLVVLG